MFEVGRVYHRRNDIHAVYGGQLQGGMATPRAHPLVLLFTGQRGTEYGYRDEIKPDGSFWYTGEGQVGDQQFTKCNKALREHNALGKAVYLFEEAGRGLVRHVGEVEYLGHHHEEQTDTNGDMRQAIVFELGFIDYTQPALMNIAEENINTDLRQLQKRSLNELRNLALVGLVSEAPKKVKRQVIRLRSNAVRAYVLKRANGVCEGCFLAAPFITKKGSPYLEPHHTTRVADGGPDHPAHVIALCPTCHRRVHYGHDGDSFNQQLINWLEDCEGTV